MYYQGYHFKHTFCPYCWDITWHLRTVIGTWLCLGCRAAGRDSNAVLSPVDNPPDTG